MSIGQEEIKKLVDAAETDMRKTLLIVALTGLTLSSTRTAENLHRDDIEYARAILAVMNEIATSLQATVDNLETKYAQLTTSGGVN